MNNETTSENVLNFIEEKARLQSRKSEEKSLSSDAFFDRLKWLTAEEASQYLRVSVKQLYNLVYRGQLKSHKLLNRRRFLRSDLDRLVKPEYFQIGK